MIADKKFVLLNESLKAIKNGSINILTLVGEAGMGKTYTTLEYLKEKKVNYKYINSYITSLSFYKMLFENRSKDVIIFDDVANINNPLTLSILKSACWDSNGKKIISYHSTTNKLEDIPKSFEITASVILVFNQIPKEYSPITNRGITIKFDFDFDEKLKIFKEVKEKAGIEQEVLDYVEKNCDDSTTNLSIRTLVILSKLKRSESDFKLFAKEMLKQDENKKLLMELSCKEWVSSTGMSRRSYFRHKYKLGLKKVTGVSSDGTAISNENT